MRNQFWPFIIIFSIIPFFSNGQSQSNLKTVWLKKTQTKVEDSLTIIPHSIKVLGAYSSNVEIDSVGNVLKYNSLSDSILVSYEVFTVKFDKKYYIRNLKDYQYRAYSRDFYNRQNYQKIDKKEEIFETKGIQKSGNITRGVSFGNNQNVFVNSSLNLQMEGDITPDVKLIAAISDQNVPIQPDGNTQQIQQFDRIYLQLVHQKGNLTMGDYVLKNKDTYFLKYLKNVQGGQLNTSFTDKKWTYNSSFGAALAKGKFGSITLQVSEGVQGPYRLNGPNNEQFIIVINNSEKVFLDGKQLQRGFNYDYVIDYNSGEITFTPNVLLTKYSRVRVDFEYSERNYSRTIMGFSHNQDNKKLNIGFDYYAETDNKNVPITLTLTDDEKAMLASVGDQIQNAVISSVDSVAFNANQVLYTDTVIGNQLVFVYSTDETKAKYRINFLNVGIGNGDYVYKSTTANGQVYEYVTPINGVRQGAFSPLKLIPTPKDKRMISNNLKYTIRPLLEIYNENAVSVYDINTFSNSDKNDNQGLASRVGMRKVLNLNDTIHKYKLGYNVDYQFVNKNFNPIDRFRDVDFDRDWSTQTNTTLSSANLNFNLSDDQLLTVATNLISNKSKYTYQFSARQKNNEASGTQQKVSLNTELIPRFLFLNGSGFLLNSNNVNYQSTWNRLAIAPSVYLKKIITTYEYSIDQNKVKWTNFNDSVSTAMNYEQHKIALKSKDTSGNKYAFDFANRKDFFPKEGKFGLATVANTLNLNNYFQLTKKQNITTVLTLRTLENNKIDSVSNKENTILGRLDWNASLLKNVIKNQLIFTVSNGRQLKRQYVFVPVPTGQGNYVWNDLNSDGVQQLNEFFEKIYNDPNGEFIRTLAPTNEYINAFSNSVNYRLNLNAPSEWRNKKAFKKFIARFSNTSSVIVESKNTSNNLESKFNPFANIPDIELISKQNIIKSATFFNRTNPAFGSDFLITISERKDLLTGGFQEKSIQEYQNNTRLNIGKIFNVKTLALSSLRGVSSDFLTTSNYTIQIYQLKPELAWQPNSAFRFTLHYSFQHKTNIHILNLGEKCKANELGLDVRVAKVSNRSLNATFKSINIYYNGLLNTQLAYDMLEALKPGQNFTWNVNWNQKLSNGLQLSFIYEGRKSPANKTINIGRMQVNALF